MKKFTALKKYARKNLKVALGKKLKKIALKKVLKATLEKKTALVELPFNPARETIRKKKQLISDGE